MPQFFIAMKIILGSQSQWRQQILKEMGYEFEVMSADIDEKAIRHKDPRDENELKYFLKTYHEAPAEPVNAIVITNTETGKRVSGIDSTRVYFKEIPGEIIEQFVKREDLYNRAGGFAIQDPLLQPYIEKIEGVLDSIAGLPKELTERLLQEAQAL